MGEETFISNSINPWMELPKTSSQNIIVSVVGSPLFNKNAAQPSLIKKVRNVQKLS